MFGAIKRLNKKVQSFSQQKAMTEILDESRLKAQIIDLNQHQLYEQGLLPDGTPTGHYAPSTIEGTSKYAGKIEKGQRYDHITLKDSGAFYDAMKIQSLPDAIQITDTDEKTEMLKQREGNMLGLTVESKQEILPEIKESLIEKFRKAIA